MGVRLVKTSIIVKVLSVVKMPYTWPGLPLTSLELDGQGVQSIYYINSLQ